MQPCALDFETCPFAPGLLAPPPVCLSYCDVRGSPGLAVGWDAMREELRRRLQGVIVGFNLPYDLAVALAWFPDLVDDVFRALDEGRIFDLQICERLDEIATGRPPQWHSLQTLAAKNGITIEKEDTPRQDYGRFLGQTELPAGHRQYALRDADVTLILWERRSKRVRLEAVASETKHALWLHLVAAWGVRTDVQSIDDLRRAASEAVAQLREQVQEYGFVRADGSTDTKIVKQAVWGAYGSNPPLTKTGIALQKKRLPWELKHVATDKVALEDSGNELLEDFARFGEWKAVLNKDIDLLVKGITDPIHTRYGMAKSTRTTSSGPNLQNFRRLHGIRECVVPREGYCFGSIDVGGLELGTLAQVIAWKLKRSEMCDLINKGVDLHLYAACRLMGWDYDWAKARRKTDPIVKEMRQFCKIANFGYPGFMGAATLVPYARKQGTRITLAQAIDLKANWEKTLPDAAAYLRWVKSQRNIRTDRYDFEIPGSPGIWQAGATIAGCANGHFQGLGAQVMKEAGWRLMRESWTDRASDLYGQKIVVFIHDEFIYEVKIGDQHRVMQRARVVLEDTLRELLPSVKMGAEPVAMPFWTKDAEAVYDEQGELAIWQPMAA